MNKIVCLQRYKVKKRWVDIYLENFQPEYISAYDKYYNNINKKQRKRIDREMQLKYMKLLTNNIRGGS